MERGRRRSESTAGSAVSKAVAKLDRVLFPRSWPAAQRIKHRRPSKFWRRIITASPETRGEILQPRQLWGSSCFAFCHFCLDVVYSSSLSSVFAICGTQRHKPLDAVICRSAATSRLPLHRVEMPHRRSTCTYCEAGLRYTWYWPFLPYHAEILRRLVSGRFEDEYLVLRLSWLRRGGGVSQDKTRPMPCCSRAAT